jgi:hypothetical protein
MSKGSIGGSMHLVKRSTKEQRAARRKWKKRQEKRWASRSGKVTTRQATPEEREQYDIA